MADEKKYINKFVQEGTGEVRYIYDGEAIHQAEFDAIIQELIDLIDEDLTAPTV